MQLAEHLNQARALGVRLHERTNELNRPAGHDLVKHVASVEFVRKLTGHYCRLRAALSLERRRRHWCPCVMRSKVEPMKGVAALVRASIWKGSSPAFQRSVSAPRPAEAEGLFVQPEGTGC